MEAGEIDGFVDYYQYTDPDGKICTGVVEHIYKDGTDTPERDTAAELAKLESKLRGKYPTATDEQISRMLAEIEVSLTGDACQSYAFSALGYGDWVYIGTMYGGTGITKHNAETMLKSIGLLKDETTGTDEEKEAAKEYNQKMIDSVVGLLYGDNYYTEHPVPTQAMLFKMNVKTGETKIIMAGSVNGSPGHSPQRGPSTTDASTSSERRSAPRTSLTPLPVSRPSSRSTRRPTSSAPSIRQ